MVEIVENWLKKIEKAEKKWDEYHKLVEEIRDYYKNTKKKNKTNIFWSSIETLKPFLYFKQPKPYIEQKNKTVNMVENQACKILENAIARCLESYDFDSVIKYARNDYLLSGMGLCLRKWQQVNNLLIKMVL